MGFNPSTNMPTFVEIANSDYEQRRHASKLAAWVNTKLRQIQDGGRLDEQYFERRGLNVKRLLEEAVPISRLGLYLWTPWAEPYVTLLPVSQNIDAEVEVQGPNARSLKVEVTTIETDESTMRRQALAREGSVQLLGSVRRSGRTITADSEMVDVDEQMERVIELTLERLRAKVESGAYDETTAILVYLSEFWPLLSEGRLELRRRTESYLAREPGKTSTVFYCFWPEYSVEAIDVRRARHRSLGAA